MCSLAAGRPLAWPDASSKLTDPIFGPYYGLMGIPRLNIKVKLPFTGRTLKVWVRLVRTEEGK